jgi:hypothetical protein
VAGSFGCRLSSIFMSAKAASLGSPALGLRPPTQGQFHSTH